MGETTPAIRKAVTGELLGKSPDSRLRELLGKMVAALPEESTKKSGVRSPTALLCSPSGQASSAATRYGTCLPSPGTGAISPSF